jgi:uncharacterized FlaG/YvyC family protein
MANDMINAVGSIQKDAVSTAQVQSNLREPVKSEPAKSEAVKGEAVKSEAVQKNPATDTPPAPQVQNLAPSHLNVQIVFKVDEKTKDLTVFVLDRSSQRVIRTIPSDEINKLKAGDLVELFT